MFIFQSVQSAGDLSSENRVSMCESIASGITQWFLNSNGNNTFYVIGDSQVDDFKIKVTTEDWYDGLYNVKINRPDLISISVKAFEDKDRLQYTILHELIHMITFHPCDGFTTEKSEHGWRLGTIEKEQKYWNLLDNYNNAKSAYDKYWDKLFDEKYEAHKRLEDNTKEKKNNSTVDDMFFNDLNETAHKSKEYKKYLESIENLANFKCAPFWLLEGATELVSIMVYPLIYGYEFPRKHRRREDETSVARFLYDAVRTDEETKNSEPSGIFMHSFATSKNFEEIADAYCKKMTVNGTPLITKDEFYKLLLNGSAGIVLKGLKEIETKYNNLVKKEEKKEMQSLK